MWLFTVHGFFSAVRPTVLNGKQKGKPEMARMMVRSRVKQHLQNLIDAYPEIEDCQIQEDVGTDYAYRIFVPNETWANLVAEMAADVDYTNFKNAAGGLSDDYHHALMSVWTVMARLQPSTRRS